MSVCPPEAIAGQPSPAPASAPSNVALEPGPRRVRKDVERLHERRVHSRNGATRLPRPRRVFRVVQLRGDLPLPDDRRRARAGARPTAICYGVLSWLIRRARRRRRRERPRGRARVPLRRRRAGLAVDDRAPRRQHGSDEQQTALETLFLDGLAQAAVDPQGPSPDRRPRERDRDRRRRASASAPRSRCSATRPVETELPVACGIPGYDRRARELLRGRIRRRRRLPSRGSSAATARSRRLRLQLLAALR